MEQRKSDKIIYDSDKKTKPEYGCSFVGFWYTRKNNGHKKKFKPTLTKYEIYYLVEHWTGDLLVNLNFQD